MKKIVLLELVLGTFLVIGNVWALTPQEQIDNAWAGYRGDIVNGVKLTGKYTWDELQKLIDDPIFPKEFKAMALLQQAICGTYSYQPPPPVGKTNVDVVESKYREIMTNYTTYPELIGEAHLSLLSLFAYVRQDMKAEAELALILNSATYSSKTKLIARSIEAHFALKDVKPDKGLLAIAEIQKLGEKPMPPFYNILDELELEADLYIQKEGLEAFTITKQARLDLLKKAGANLMKVKIQIQGGADNMREQRIRQKLESLNMDISKLEKELMP